MPEQMCTVGGDVELCYETFGDPEAPAMLLTMGLATQMLGWHEDFCEELAGRGFHVIRFDNRDVGRSQRMNGKVPSVFQLLRRDKRAASYTLEDMAGDAVGLLDHLGIDAGARDRRVDGRHDRPDDGGAAPGPRALAGVDDVQQRRALERPAASRPLPRAAQAAGPRPRGLHGPRRLGLLAHRLAGLRARRRRPAPDRRHELRPRDQPGGSLRQLAAIIASGNRTPLLRTITAPTLVIHGTKDRLVPPSGGRATAKAIPGARLLLIEGLGHDIPRAAWPRLLDAIEQNAARAGTPAPTR